MKCEVYISLFVNNKIFTKANVVYIVLVSAIQHLFATFPGENVFSRPLDYSLIYILQENNTVHSTHQIDCRQSIMYVGIQFPPRRGAQAPLCSRFTVGPFYWTRNLRGLVAVPLVRISGGLGCPKLKNKTKKLAFLQSFVPAPGPAEANPGNSHQSWSGSWSGSRSGKALHKSGDQSSK